LTKNSPPQFFYGYVVVLLAFIIMVVTWGTFYTFGVFFKPVLTEFDWTRTGTSGAYSLAFMVSGFLSIVAGRLNDRFGPRVVVSACGVLLCSGYLLMSQVSAIWQLYLFYGIVGIGLSGAYVPSISAVSRWFVKRRGLMTGIAMAGIGAGTMITPPVTNWLISNYGWRTSYIVIGIVVLVLMVLAAQFLKRDPTQMRLIPYGEGVVESQNSDLEARGFSFQEAIRTWQFWVVCGMFTFSEFCVQTITVHIVPHATDLAISAANAAGILAIIGGAGVTGRVMMGGAGDRVGNKPATTICLIMMLASLLWLLAAEELRMFYLFAVVFGFAYGGYQPLISLVVAELFGLSSLGVILGAVTFSITIGAAVGPALAGRIFDITGSYQSAFLVCAALSIVAIILTLFIKPITNKGRISDPRRST